jgi:outer membrane scaffolding protein for murein synthesis (MipA/OmpV family)
MLRYLFVLFLSALLAPFAAHGQLRDMPEEAAGDVDPRKPESDWVIRLGAFGIVTPEYEGSDDFKIRGFPVIDLEYKERFFLNPVKGLGMWFWRGSSTRVGASVGYRAGRDEDDSSKLEGLGDVDGGATANLYLEWQSRPWSADLHYSRQFTGDDTGTRVDLRAGYGFRLVGPVFLKPSVRIRYADSDYNQSNFGITPRQAANSGLPEYDADGDINSVGAGLVTLVFLSKHWSVQLIANYERLIGDAGDSPIVQERNQFRAGVGLSYQF